MKKDLGEAFVFLYSRHPKYEQVCDSEGERGGRGLPPTLEAIAQVCDSEHVTVLSLPVFLFDHHIVPVGS